MSVEIWYNPNDPKPIKTPYPIGTEGREYISITKGNGIFDNFANIVRGLYNNIRVFTDIFVPTYGLWAGPGYAGGVR